MGEVIPMILIIIERESMEMIWNGCFYCPTQRGYFPHNHEIDSHEKDEIKR